MDDAEAALLCPKCSLPLDDHCDNPECDWLECRVKVGGCGSYGDFDRWVTAASKAKPA